MSIQTERELHAMRCVGRVVAMTLRELRHHLRPGISTAELDRIAADFLDRNNARPAPTIFVGYPAAICISINEQAVHGLPGSRQLQPGDLVKLDVAAELDGYVADAAITVPIPPIKPVHQRLCDCAGSALWAGMNAARIGRPVYEIGKAVEEEVHRHGFYVLRELGGHGVGRKMWEEPHIPNFADPRHRARLVEGMVITIEPIISAGSRKTVMSDDRWTLSTSDSSDSAHVEHTLMITRDGPIILTAA